MPSWWTVTFLLLATTSQGFAPRRRRTYQSSPRRTYQSSPRLRAGETTDATSATDVGGTTTATPPPPASYGGIDGNRFPYGDPSNVDRLFSNLNYEKTGGTAGGGNSEGVGRALVAERKEGSLLAATSLVTGTTIGAGILALPAVSLPAGTIPSTLVLVACWAYMAASGLLVAEVNLNSIFASGRPGFSVLSMTRLYLGEAGGLLSGAAYVFIHDALLVAYIAQGGGVLGEQVGELGKTEQPVAVGERRPLCLEPVVLGAVEDEEQRTRQDSPTALRRARLAKLACLAPRPRRGEHADLAEQGEALHGRQDGTRVSWSSRRKASGFRRAPP